MIWVVLRVSLRLLSDTPSEFGRSMLSIPNIGYLFQHA
jgi:hypothetical protein